MSKKLDLPPARMSNIALTDEQMELLPKLAYWYNNFKVLGKPWFSLSGAAGTGKTTVIRYFIESMGIGANDFICAAYVGKAVTLLASHGLPAKTIHSLIYMTNLVPVYDESGEPLKNRAGYPILKIAFELKPKLDYPYKLIVIDEASMVDDKLRDEILSFGVPVIFIGDMNQLPPIFGQSSVMLHPDFVLTKIMRQAKDNPIIYLSQSVLHGRGLQVGTYGDSIITDELIMDSRLLDDYDIILTTKNSTREMFTNYIRRDLLKIKKKYPVIGDKLICRQNNWALHLGNGFYLTNGTAGTVVDIYRETITKKKAEIEFMSDYTKTTNRLPIDWQFIQLPYEDRKTYGLSSFNKFEYGYAITTHLSQGSQWPRVLFIDEFFHSAEDTKKMRYTAITRAQNNIHIITTGRKFKNW